MPTIWIAQLFVSPAVATKLEAKHGISVAELEEHLVAWPGLLGRWDDDPIRGRRAVLRVYIRQRPVRVVLYPQSPADPGTWNLGSAYFEQ